MKTWRLILALVFACTVFAAAGERKIAFERNDAVWIAKLDGTGEKKIADGIFPSISPDGTRVAFTTSEKSGTTYVRHIAVIEIESGSMKVFKDVPSDNSYYPSWSPDGKHILFTLRQNEVWDLATIAPDGTDFQIVQKGTPQSFCCVLMASYNSAAWIKHTIRSVLEQTYRNFEVIVVGDGCTDGTEELLKTKFGKRIRWKNLQSNSGSQSAPNNEGIRVAHGSHIAYLGHDDIWSRYHLELLDGVVREQDPDFAVSGAVYHGPPGSMFYQIAGIFDDPDMVRREFFPPSSFAHRS